MTIWEQLGIERTRDKRKIRHAYAKMAAQYHPEEHPEEFKEIYDAYQEALSYASRPVFDEDTDAAGSEGVVNETSSQQSPEQDGDAIDFSVFDIDKESSEKELIQLRLIDGVLENIQKIIEKPEENIVRKIAKKIFGTDFDRQLTEWKRLLTSSGFQKVRGDRNFIVKLNELKCISLLSADMAERLYEKLDFKFIEERFERTDYQDLQSRLQKCIDSVEELREARRAIRTFYRCVNLIICLIIVFAYLFFLFFILWQS